MKQLMMLFVALFLSAAVPVPTNPVTTVILSSSELDDLAAPIALYPDPLLGLILPASVFPDQIIDAALLIRTKSDAPLIAQQSWEDSVKGIATYPGVLKMMYEKIDWTTKLGNAFLYQSPDLRDAIQRLRVKAQQVGNLRTTEEQKVTTGTVNGKSTIQIEPASPEVVYVPQYSTQVVYTEKTSSDSNYLVPLATFGLGLALGSALSDDDDDHVHYYGGYPGSVVWYNDNSVNTWVDNRQDMIRNSQEHRQDVQKDRINYRQDMREDRTNFRQDQIESGNYPDKAARDEYRQQQSTNRQDQASSAQARREENRASLSGSQQSQDLQARKQQAQQRSQEWKSTAADRGYSRSSASSTANAARANRSASQNSMIPNYGSGSSSSNAARSSALQGYSSRSSASAYGSRGSSSRSASGYSRPSGGGMARSGGGGRRR